MNNTMKPKQVTLTTLNDSSSQEVFDWISYNLLRQNAHSMVAGLGLGCAYRGYNNTKCAVGWLMSDDEYSPDFEGHGWSRLVASYKLSRKHLNIINELQYVHDDCRITEWKLKLIDVACRYKLNYNIIQEFK